MNIETVDDLAMTIGDWLGIYGGCKSDGDEGCKYNKDKPFCCRQGLVQALSERMVAAVENDKKLEEINLK